MKIASLAIGAILASSGGAANAEGTCPPHDVTRGFGIQPEAQQNLADAIALLRSHAVAGPSNPILNQTEIIAASNNVAANSHQLTSTYDLLSAALDLVDEYEANGYGPVLINSAATAPWHSNSFNRIQGTDDGREMDRTMMVVQQAILDEAYHASLWGNPETGQKNFGSDMLDWGYKPIVKECQDLFRGRKWMAAQWMPGLVDPPADNTTTHVVTVDASYRPVWGRPTAHTNLKRAIRPIGGLYLAPGEIAVVTVPPELVGKGFHVQIGSRMVDCSRKADRYSLQDRMTSSYPVEEEVTHVANPYGGELFLRSPYGSVVGPVNLQVSGGVVQSASFFQTSVKNTTEEEWQFLRVNAPAPWVVIETESYLLTWPANGVRDLDYAWMAERAKNYTEVYNAVSRIQGIPPERRNTYVLYEMPSTCGRAGGNAIGYPQANDPIHGSIDGPRDFGEPWDPIYGWQCCGRQPIPFEQDPEGDEVWNRYVSHHELGHQALYRYSVYGFEKESIVHVGYTYARNTVYGDDLDTSFMFSWKGLQNPATWAPRFTLDRTAMDWMVRDTFLTTGAMSFGETSYNHRGHAKYVEIAKLLGGWEYLEKLALEEHERWENEGFGNVADYFDKVGDGGFFTQLPAHSKDERTLRLSIHAGQDLTPLIHFWGVPPDDYALLKQLMLDRGLEPSREAKNILLRYMALIPKNAEEYTEFYESLWVPSLTNKCHGDCSFHQQLAASWNNTNVEAIQDTVLSIIQTYWPASGVVCIDTSSTRQRSLEIAPPQKEGSFLRAPAKPSTVEPAENDGRRNLEAAAQAAHEYMVALNKWSSLGPPLDYVFDIDRDFFGPEVFFGPFNVLVEDGIISEATDVSGEVVDPSNNELLTIRALFDFIAQSMDKGSFVSVQYDDEKGYPVLIEIISSDDEDEELEYVKYYLSDVKIFDEGTQA